MPLHWSLPFLFRSGMRCSPRSGRPGRRSLAACRCWPARCALAGSLAPDFEAHHYSETVLVSLIEDLLAGRTGLICSPGAERVGSMLGQKRNASCTGRLPLKAGTLDVERLSATIDAIDTVLQPELGLDRSAVIRWWLLTADQTQAE